MRESVAEAVAVVHVEDSRRMLRLVITIVLLVLEVFAASNYTDDLLFDSQCDKFIPNLFAENYARFTPAISKKSNSSDFLLDVFFWSSLDRVIAVDDHDQKITLSYWGYLVWVDKRLSWSAEDCNLSSTYVKPDVIWTPKIGIEQAIGIDHYLQAVGALKVFATGEVIMEFFVKNLDIFCSFDSWRFPFGMGGRGSPNFTEMEFFADKQKCLLSLYSSTIENLTADSIESESNYLSEVSTNEWTLSSFEVEKRKYIYHDTITLNSLGKSLSWKFTGLHYTFIIERSAMQHILVWILLPRMLTIIGFFGSTLKESTDSSSVTISLAVILISLVATLPVQKRVSIISKYTKAPE